MMTEHKQREGEKFNEKWSNNTLLTIYVTMLSPRQQGIHTDSTQLPDQNALQSTPCLVSFVEDEVLEPPHRRRQVMVFQVVVESARCSHHNIRGWISLESADVLIDALATDHADEAHVVERLCTRWSS